MASTPRLTDLRRPTPTLSTTRRRKRQHAVRPQPSPPAALPARRRFDRVALGFWLGAVALATVGCILGARMTYRYPVALVVSVLWWSIYLGCIGASVGALIGLLMNPSAHPVPPDGPSETRAS